MNNIMGKNKHYFNKSKIIIGDMMLNVIASVLPVIILQFFIIPMVAKSYDDYNYGLMITLISLVTVSVQSISVSLTNSRLLLDSSYKSAGISGDFNVLLIIYSIANILIVAIGTYLYEGYFNLLNVFLIVVFAIIQLVRRYLIVSFRLNLNFKNILYSNIILMIGYLGGLVLFLFIQKWQLIYILGELVSLLFVIKKTGLLVEPYKKTFLFKKTFIYGLIIFIASFLDTVTSNIDRLFLYPLLGPKMVAIYYVSTLFGKMILMLVGPINNVILSYLSKMKQFNISSFKLMISLSAIIGILSYVFIILLSEPILNFLYPMYASEAIKLTYITTLTAIAMMLSSVINPVIMKFCNISWQIWVNVINIVFYLLLAYYLVGLYSIYGFCYASLIAAILKVIILVIVYVRNHKGFNTDIISDFN